MLAPNILKRITSFVILLASAFLLSIFASFCLYLSTKDSQLLYILGASCVFLYIVFIYFIIKKWKKFANNASGNTRSIIINVIWLLFSVILTIVFTLILKEPQHSNKDFTNYTANTLIFMFIFYVCFAPIVEETICRGLFLSMFFTKTNTKSEKIINIIGGSVVSAYISTALHGYANLNSIIIIFINGIIAAFLYHKSNTIIFPIIFHVFINILAWSGSIILMT
ncbi:CPBP family intramembrane metalloprotease [Staphylococcus pseudintermedius]|nr:CPBP family intramembrane metalloprotease [Staphylococcus pseudintermedius]MDE9937900.1 type II CAAX endopeptidase family protein [Staphylococcus pseudintermedius]